MADNGAMTTAYLSSLEDLPRYGHREFRQNLAPILSRVHGSGGAIEIMNGAEREVVVVDYAVFRTLRQALREQESLRSSLALVVAAASAGVAIPSATLSEFGVELPVNPDALKQFRSMYPIQFTHDEEGNSITEVSGLILEPVTFSDDEPELAELST